MSRFRRPRAALFALLLGAAGATLGAEQPLAPAPYEASYRVHYGPVSVGTIDYALAPAEEDRWVFRGEAHPSAWAGWLPVDSLNERSRFRYRDGRLLPERYETRGQTDDGPMARALVFDEAGQRVAVYKDGQLRKTLDVPAGTYDPALLQLVLRHEVARGERAIRYRFVDGGKLKTYRFEVRGEEPLDTPAGLFDTVRVVRVDDPDKRSVLWLAPTLDYLPVQFEQREAGRPTVRLALRRLERD